MNDLLARLMLLKQRLRTAYDGIGHSHGRPYVYFVYAPEQERVLLRHVDDELLHDGTLSFYHLDVLAVTMQSTAGQEPRREELLNDPVKGSGAAESLFRLWARSVSRAISQQLEVASMAGRPVIVLRGLAALHPLGTPTSLMETLAEQEARDPVTGQIVPVVLLVPGVRPPQTSREYLFLGQPRLQQTFYRGEEA